MADVGDLVLIHIKDAPGFFARIEAVEPDAKRGWWRVKLLVLAVPLQVITWILRSEYIRGEEFTMDEVSVRLEKVEPPEEPGAEDDHREENGEPGKVVSIFERKKKT